MVVVFGINFSMENIENFLLEKSYEISHVISAKNFVKEFLPHFRMNFVRNFIRTSQQNIFKIFHKKFNSNSQEYCAIFCSEM